MFINLIIKSKNRKSIFYFLHVINKFNKNKKVKITPKFFKTKRFTVLKSPHVNKTAQEQFESNLFSINVRINSSDILKFLILIKNVQNRFCYDIYIKTIFNTKNQKIKKNFFNYKPKILLSDNQFDFKKLLSNLNYYGIICN